VLFVVCDGQIKRMKERTTKKEEEEEEEEAVFCYILF
jgi:hypothetical protein